MKTATTEYKSTTNARSSSPFFSKNGAGGFLSPIQKEETPFFRPVTVQPKSTIGQPNDEYEREADAMADRVIQRLQQPATKTPESTSIQKEVEEEPEMEQEEESGPEIRLQSMFSSDADPPEEGIQRKCAACEEEEATLQRKSNLPAQLVSTKLVSLLQSSKGGGHPLPVDTRSNMESAFGTDFSGVRVHTGSSAVKMNQSLSARAFTHGADIYFNRGQYNPGSTEGQRLLGHELTHAVQQGGANKKATTPNTIFGKVKKIQLEEASSTSTTRTRRTLADVRESAFNALQTTENRIQEAIRQRDEGNQIPEDLSNALARFFPGQTEWFLDLLLTRIGLIQPVVTNVRIRFIREVTMAMGAVDPNAALHRGAIRLGTPAVPFPDNHFIAIYPAWYWSRNRPLQPAILIHESFHYYFGHMRGHPRRTSTINAFAYQGFISVLGGLPTGPLVNQQYPPL